MKQGTPFKGGGVINARAANEFMPAISFFYEAGSAEDGDDFAACESGERKVELG
jgi:hypothetical protein